MYTSSEINIALLGNLEASVYDIYTYSSGTTLWKKINVVEDAEGCFNSNYQCMLSLILFAGIYIVNFKLPAAVRLLFCGS